MTPNVHAFVLLGLHPFVTPGDGIQTLLLKIKIYSVAQYYSVKLGQKRSSEPKVETQYSSAPIAQMQCCLQ